MSPGPRGTGTASQTTPTLGREMESPRLLPFLVTLLGETGHLLRAQAGEHPASPFLAWFSAPGASGASQELGGPGGVGERLACPRVLISPLPPLPPALQSWAERAPGLAGGRPPSSPPHCGGRHSRTPWYGVCLERGRSLTGPGREARILLCMCVCVRVHVCASAGGTGGAGADLKLMGAFFSGFPPAPP